MLFYNSLTLLVFIRSTALFLGCWPQLSIATSRIDFSTLRQVHIISRHGLRSPEFPFPNDAYKDVSKYWPNGWGQLTEIGIQQQFELGIFLRKRYKDLISPTFLSTEILAVSSGYDRTILSVELALAGLYGQQDEGITFKSFAPVHSIPKSIDRMIQPNLACPRQNKLNDELDPFMLQLEANGKDMIDFLRGKMGYEPQNKDEIYHSIGTLMVQRASNLTIPDWANEILDSEIKMKIITDGFKMFTRTEELKRLSAGAILSEIVKNMLNSINGTESRKLYFYGGHDILIANVLNTIGVFDSHWPDFSSCIFFELYLDTSTHDAFIQISYKNSTTQENIYEFELPKCKSPCPIKKFIQEYKYYLPLSEELDQECQLKEISSKLTTLESILIGTVIALGALIIALSIFTFRKFGNNASYPINSVQL